MDLDDFVFTKQQKCGACGEPLNQGDNWGCAHAWVPISGFVEMVVELHQHVHIRCAEGFVKWMALSKLGNARVGLN